MTGAPKFVRTQRSKRSAPGRLFCAGNRDDWTLFPLCSYWFPNRYYHAERRAFIPGAGIDSAFFLLLFNRDSNFHELVFWHTAFRFFKTRKISYLTSTIFFRFTLPLNSSFEKYNPFANPLVLHCTRLYFPASASPLNNIATSCPAVFSILNVVLPFKGTMKPMDWFE